MDPEWGQPNAGDVAMERKLEATACLGFMASACCPAAVRWLRATGYSQALVIRTATHGVLWFSCIITFLFSIVWFTNVLTLGCIMERECSTAFMGVKRCIWEAVGVLIFSSSFGNNVQMIAHFDDDRQRVLTRKRLELRTLKAESETVFRRAEELVQNRSHELMELLEKGLARYASEVAEILLPKLRPAHLAAAPELEAEVKKLEDVLRKPLAFPRDLASAMHEELAWEHPEVHARAFGGRHQQQRQRGAGGAMAGGATGALRQFDAWLRRSAGAEAAGPPRLDAELPLQIARDLLQPIKELLMLPDRCSELKQQLDEEGPHLRSLRPRERGMGCGVPPWAAAADAQRCGCACRLPHSVAKCFSCLRRCICCYCLGGGGCCASAREIDCYPKRYQVFCVWFQVHTKFQERLLQSFSFTCLYLAIYCWWAYDALVGGFPSHSPQCLQSYAVDYVAAWALLLYLPALCFCIYRVDRLDAVMDTMETIWDLQDIQQVVSTFSRYMEDGADHIRLLSIVQEHGLLWQDLVMDANRCVGDWFHEQEEAAAPAATASASSASTAPQLEAVLAVVRCLQQASKSLPSTSQWLHMPEVEWEARKAEVKERASRCLKASIPATASLRSRGVDGGTFSDDLPTSTFSDREDAPPPGERGSLAEPLLR